jgi:hypothetical protein
MRGGLSYRGVENIQNSDERPIKNAAENPGGTFIQIKFLNLFSGFCFGS